MTIKKRTSLVDDAKFRTAETDNGEKVIEGYFVVFDELTNLFGDFYEKVSSDAISDNINNQDVRALYDHDTSKVLGRTKSGTLTLTKDSKGLWGKITVNEDDSEALSIYSKIKRGDVSQASFGFYINDEDYTSNGNSTISTLTDIELFEVSVIAFPAYASTEISARSKDVESFKQRQFEARKNKLLNQLKERSHA
ncbi:HK97 family phage prohead protease [Holzapfeliella sp. JNUCC 80]